MKIFKDFTAKTVLLQLKLHSPWYIQLNLYLPGSITLHAQVCKFNRNENMVYISKYTIVYCGKYANIIFNAHICMHFIFRTLGKLCTPV